MFIQKVKHSRFFKSIAFIVLIAFISLIPLESGYAQTLPKAVTTIPLTPAFTPTLMAGLRVDPKNPFNFYFLMSNGEKILKDDQKQEEYKKLIKYFMASLITPNEDTWVNLSPKEADRIIPDNFSLTEMGRDLLSQDYLLKQFTASLMYPEGGPGKEFWDKIYKKAYAQYGTTDIPIDTFNKVWITPDRADIYQKDDTAFLVKSHLKVMLEQDFMATRADRAAFSKTSEKEDPSLSSLRNMVSDVVREVMIPVIEKEVNEGSNFAQVRQVYSAMIMASWFKKTLKDSLLGQVYADQNKVAGIALSDPRAKDEIYQQYLKAYKKGVFNFIREEVDFATQEMLPRKYFAGGMNAVDLAMINTTVGTDQALDALKGMESLSVAAVTLTTPEGQRFSPDVQVAAEQARPAVPAVSTTEIQPAVLEEQLAVVKDAIAQADEELASLRRRVTELTSERAAALQAAEEMAASQGPLREEAIDIVSGPEVEKFNELLANIVHGEQSFSDTQVLDAVINGVLAFQRAGHRSFVRDRIAAYQKLLEPAAVRTAVSPQMTKIEADVAKVRAGLDEEQINNVAFLLNVLEQEYLVLEPLDAIQNLKLLPFDIQVQARIDKDTVDEIAGRMAEARDAIEAAREQLSFESSSLFSEPLTVKIVDQVDPEPGQPPFAIAYKAPSREIQIGPEALGLSGAEFALAVRSAMEQAVLNRIQAFLKDEFGSRLDEKVGEQFLKKMSTVTYMGRSLKSFITFLNTKDRLTPDDVNSFLDKLLVEEITESELVDLTDYEMPELVPSESEATPGRFSAGLGSVWRYLKEHPAVALVPIVLIASASGALAQTQGAGFHPGALHPNDSGPLPVLDQGAHPAPLVLDHILSLGAAGQDVSKVGAEVMKHVTADDVRHLAGEKSITGAPYDSDYFSRNAERIVANARSSIEQGVYSRDVERVVVAFEHAHGLAEDGDVGPQVLKALNGTAPAVEIPAAGPPPNVLTSPGNVAQGLADHLVLGGATGAVNEGRPSLAPSLEAKAAVPAVAGAALSPTAVQGYQEVQQDIARLNQVIDQDAQAILSNVEGARQLRNEIEQEREREVQAQRAKQSAAAKSIQVGSAPPPPSEQLELSAPAGVSTVAAVTFTSDAGRISYIDQQRAEKMKAAAIGQKNKLPISGVVMLNNNAIDLGVGVPLGGGVSFNLVPDLPGREILTGVRIGQGLAKFGTLPAVSQVAGPLFEAQIVSELTNYVRMHPTRGQDVKFNANMTVKKGILQTFTVHVTPIESYDQNNKKVTKNLYTIGLVDTFQAALGKLDKLLGNTGFLGDSSRTFVSTDMGYQLKINTYHQAFESSAARNRDPNTFYVKVYQINDAETRYRQTKRNGWERVEQGTTPLDPAKDYRSATVRGFALHYEPGTGTITGREVFAAPTFMTDQFAETLAKPGVDHMREPLLERAPSVYDLEKERILAQGKDAEGRIILGALRDMVTGRITRFITDQEAGELNTLRSRTTSDGQKIFFVPGQEVRFAKGQAGKVGAGNVAADYVRDEVARVKNEWTGLFRPGGIPVKPGKAESIIAKRPGLSAVPEALSGEISTGALLFEPAPAMEAITAAGNEQMGILYFSNGHAPVPVTDMKGLKPVQYVYQDARKENRPSGVVFDPGTGMYSVDGFAQPLPGNALVFVNAEGQASGIFSPSAKAKAVMAEEAIRANVQIEAHKNAMSGYGLVTVVATGEQVPLDTLPDHFVTAKAGGVAGQEISLHHLDGTTESLKLTDNRMVRVSSGQVVELLETGLKTKQSWALVLGMLKDQQAVEVVDEVSGKAQIYASTNELSKEQRAAHVQPSSDLVDLVASNRIKMVPVDPDQPNGLKRMVVSATANPVIDPKVSPRTGEGNAKYTHSEFLANNVLVIAKDARGHEITQFMPVDALNSISVQPKEVLQLGPDGRTIGRGVNEYRTGWRVASMEDLPQYLAEHVLVVPQGTTVGLRTASFMPLKDLDKLSAPVKEVLQIGADGKTVGRAVNEYKTGWRVVSMEDLPQYLAGHVLVVPRGAAGRGTGQFVPLQKITAPAGRGASTTPAVAPAAKAVTPPAKVAAPAEQKAPPAVRNVPASTYIDPGTTFRGVTFSPVPAGVDRLNWNWNDAVSADIDALKALGVNSVRVYTPITSKSVLKKFREANISIVVGIPYHDDRKIPAAEKVDIRSGSFRQFVRDVFPEYPQGSIIEAGNEYNYHPEWFDQDINNWYAALEKTAREIHAISPGIIVASAHGEVPSVEVLRKVPSVDWWGMNIYRGNDPAPAIREFLARVRNTPGLNPNLGCYASEIGASFWNKYTRSEDQKAQADAYVAMLDNLSRIQDPGFKGAFLMTAKDESWKASQDETEAHFGLVTEQGAKKPAYGAVQDFWRKHPPSQRPVQTVARPAVSEGPQRAGQAVPGEVRVRPAAEVAGLLDRSLDILQLDETGATAARGVRIYGGQYKIVPVGGMTQFLRQNWMALRKDGTGAEYITLEQMRDPQVYQDLLNRFDAVEMHDVNNQLVARVYLNRNINGSRIEVIRGNTSTIFPFMGFDWSDLSHPQERMESRLEDGLLHVVTTSLLEVNKGVVVEDVFQPVQGGKPVLLYSVRRLQKEIIYFKNGHERYSVSTDAGNETGQTVVIDGQPVENVVGLYQYDEQTKTGYFVNLRRLKQNDYYAAVRRTVFEDGQLSDDRTGFVKLEAGLSAEEINQRVLAQSQLLMQDAYQYDGIRGVSGRQVTLQANGEWGKAWSIHGGKIAPQPELVRALMNKPEIARVLAKHGISPTTVLLEAYPETSQGVKTIDYRIPYDVQEKRFITVRQQAGSIIEIIVGLDFDARTGEQTLAYTLTPDFQIKSIMRTVANAKTIQEILPKNVGDVYRDLARRRFSLPNADLWEDMRTLGIGRNFVPIEVEEIPFLVASDHPDHEAYKSMEATMRSLVEKYQATQDQTERDGYLNSIREAVREHQAKAPAHYTDVQGKPIHHYLLPNDSRGRDIAVRYANGQIELSMWWFEGREMSVMNGDMSKVKEPIGISPGVMVVDEKDGKLLRSILFKHTEPVSVRDLNGRPQQVQANFYHVMDAPFLRSVAYTPGGQLIIEDFSYVLNRIAGGTLGVETKGQERITYDIHAPYRTPLYGVLREDGRLTKVNLHQQFSTAGQNDQHTQEVLSTALETAPTAPNRRDVHTTQFMDGEAQSKWQEGIWSGYANDLKTSWKLFAGIAAGFAGLFVSGWAAGKRWISKKTTRGPAKTHEGPSRGPGQVGGIAGVGEAPRVPVTDRPTWNNYGFDDQIADNARRVFEGSVLSRLERGESLKRIFDETFYAYRPWRRYMGKTDDFEPTMEDLWVMQLISGGSDILGNDMSDYISYIFDKTLEARRNGQGDGIGAFIRKEYTRWHNILQVQFTSFQGLSGGDAKHIVPYQYYFRQDDLNDLFRMKNFVTWYDGLGYTFDDAPDARTEIYDDFTAKLSSKALALIRDLQALAPKVDKNLFRMKRLSASLASYKEYVNYFRGIQSGEGQLSDGFAPTTISREEAERRLAGKPLMAKTFSDTIAENGRAPHAFRMLKSVFQVLRNEYRPLAYTAMMAFASVLGVLWHKGIIASAIPAVAAVFGVSLPVLSAGASLGAAVGIYFAIGGLLKGGYHALNAFLERNVGSHAFGKVPPPWEGYEKPKLSWSDRLYRGAFWSILTGAKVAWEAFLFFCYLIPFAEHLGAAWQPVIPFIGTLPFNMNPLALVFLWMPILPLYYVSSFPVFYQLQSFFGYVHGKFFLRLGVVKTSKDIRKLQEKGALNDMLDDKLLPSSVVPEERKANARREILSTIFEQPRMRDEITDEELEAAREGKLDQFSQDYFQGRTATFVNSLQMDMPDRPKFDNIKTLSALMPIHSEDVVYMWTGAPTALNEMVNVGWTNLNYIVSRNVDSWKAFIQRMRRQVNTAFEEGKLDQTGYEKRLAEIDELERMLPEKKGQVQSLVLPNDFSDDLKMEVRLWASYRGQPAVRTIDGLMNYVRVLRAYARIDHPEWDETKIREEVQKKFQLVWAHQTWGDILSAQEGVPGQEARVQTRKDVVYLLKRFHEELGFDIELASLQKRGNMFYKVLSRYDGGEGTRDIYAIPLTVNNPIVGEGKPGNQTHALTFMRGEIRKTIDMNQDLYPEQALKLPILLEEFNEEGVGIVGYPEDVFAKTFSSIGNYSAVGEETHTATDMRTQAKLGNRLHEGHPDLWRTSLANALGGMSSTTNVNEDVIAGMLRKLKGIAIKFREYIRGSKAREVSWPGASGLYGKFGMGGFQQMMGRFIHWFNQGMGPGEAMAQHFGGVGFYMKEPVILGTLFSYVTFVMYMGLSLFTGFTVQATIAFAGLFVFGQAIVLKAYLQMALEKGAIKGTKEFLKVLPGMTAFFLAHVFTQAIGGISGLLGVSTWVNTGRGHNLDHKPADQMLKGYAKSHIFPASVGLAIALGAIQLWFNPTLIWSAPFILIFLCATIMPIIYNNGTLPINGVKAEVSLKLFKEDLTIIRNFIPATFREGMKARNYRKAFLDVPIYAVAALIWLAVAGPTAGITALKSVFKGPGKPRPRPQPVEEPATAPVQMAPTATVAGLDANLAVAKRRSVWFERRRQALAALGGYWQGKLLAVREKFARARSADNAQAARTAEPVGGIDMNDEHLTINIKIDENGMPLSARFQDQSLTHIQGLTPVIRSIEPLSPSNMPVLAELMRGEISR